VETYPRDLIDAIARRHGLAGEPELLTGGLVNEAWRIGGHVLRIVRKLDCDDEAAREAAIAPLVAAAGVCAPRLVAADLDRTLAPRPYTIYEHAPGVLLGNLAPDPVRWAPAFRQLGAELARVAAIDADDALRPHLHTRNYDPRRRLRIARERGALDAATADDLAAWLDETEPQLGAPAATAFLHNDVHPWNLLVDPETDRLTAILDWGDAGVGDPSLELTSMPLFALPAMLDGYRDAGGPVDDRMHLRAIWIGMALCLWEIVELDAGAFDRRWWRMPPGGWAAIRATLPG
jgi:aminoglycoside phosphotransferase (APT) family kinase protein